MLSNFCPMCIPSLVYTVYIERLHFPPAESSYSTHLLTSDVSCSLIEVPLGVGRYSFPDRSLSGFGCRKIFLASGWDFVCTHVLHQHLIYNFGLCHFEGTKYGHGFCGKSHVCELLFANHVGTCKNCSLQVYGTLPCCWSYVHILLISQFDLHVCRVHVHM